MELEQESRYLTLTKKQREKLKRNVLHRYHDLGERVYSENAQELFEGTGIPQEIINEEIAKIKPKRVVQEQIQKTGNEYMLKSEKREKEGKKESSSTFSKICQGVYGYSRGVLEHITILPTAIRKDINYINRDSKKGKKDSIAEDVYTLSMMAPPPASLGWLFMVGITYDQLFKANPKIGAIVLATNIGTNLASLGYELIRHKHKKWLAENQ